MQIFGKSGIYLFNMEMDAVIGKSAFTYFLFQQAHRFYDFILTINNNLENSGTREVAYQSLI